MKKNIVIVFLTVVNFSLMSSELNISNLSDTILPNTNKINNAEKDKSKQLEIILPKAKLVSKTDKTIFKKVEIGMLVFNTNNMIEKTETKNSVPFGIVFWNGQEWEALKETKMPVIYENGLTLKDNKVALGGLLIKPTTIESSKENPLYIKGLEKGDISYEIVIIDPISNQLKVRKHIVETASNGITKQGNNYQLGGALTSPTVITTDKVNTLSISGLTEGMSKDKILVLDPATNQVKVRKRIVETASNGITKQGNDYQLGGALTSPTVITTDKVNTLSISGLTEGVSKDKILVLDPATNQLKVRNRVIDVADNGVTKTGDTFKLGGKLISPTVISTDATNILSIKGIQKGTRGDRVLLSDAITGEVKWRDREILTSDNGITRTGDMFKLGGTLSTPTTITTDSKNTLSFLGLQEGLREDKIIILDLKTNQLKVRNRVIDVADNGVTKTGDTFKLGGKLISPTVISTDATNILSIKGIQKGTREDRVLLSDAITGQLKWRDREVLKSDNGITREGDVFKLGGKLSNPTIIETDGTNTFSIKGIQEGTREDRVLLSDAITGQLKWRDREVLKSDNGITREGDVFKLGGKLNKPTIIETDGTNTFSIKGTQKGVREDKIMLLDPLTGEVKWRDREILTSDNGITRTGDMFKLGGVLSNPTTITTDSKNTLSFLGLQEGLREDKIVILDSKTNQIKVRDRVIDIADNGITKENDKFVLGGKLNRPTTIETDAKNILSLSGLQEGKRENKIVVLDPATNQLKIRDREVLKSDNGITREGDVFKLGGKLNKPTIIETDGVNTLSVKGIQKGTREDRVLLSDAITGQLKWRDREVLKSDNGITREGDVFKLGGKLSNPTIIETDGTNTFSIKGTQKGVREDKIMLLDPLTGEIKWRDIIVLSGGNGITRTGDMFNLGGILSNPTTITTDTKNTLSLKGLTEGTREDKILLIDKESGVLKWRERVVLSAGNGILKEDDKFIIGGKLSTPILFVTDEKNNFGITGLQEANYNEDLILMQTKEGVFRYGRGTALSSLIASSKNNTIDNQNFSQTWNWSKIKDENALNLISTSMNTGYVLNIETGNLTTGGGISIINKSEIFKSAEGLLKIHNNSNSNKGVVARIKSNKNIESGLTILANGNSGFGRIKPKNILDIAGGVVIGKENYNLAPKNGLLVEGNVGIGNIVNTKAELEVKGRAVFGKYPMKNTNRDHTINSNITLSGKSTDYNIVIDESNKSILSHRWNASNNSEALFLKEKRDAWMMNVDVFNDAYLTFNYGDGSKADTGDYVNWVTHLAVIKNGNIGIGTKSPRAKLEIDGKVLIAGGDPGEGKVLTSNKDGLASWKKLKTKHSDDDWEIGVESITLKDSLKYVGIGTNSPNAKFHVVGTTILDGTIITKNNWISPNGDKKGIYISPTGNVGIGTDKTKALLTIETNKDYGVALLSVGNTLLKSNEKQGLFSINMGYGSSATGNYATAIGYGNRAIAESSMALGYYTQSGSYAQTSVGTYNAAIEGVSSRWSNTDPIFDIGIGTSSTTRASALTVLKNGNIGIGTINPKTKLEVEGMIKITGGDPGAGKVLTSDQYGVASWKEVVFKPDNDWIMDLNSKTMFLGVEDFKIGVGTNNPQAPIQISVPETHPGAIFIAGSEITTSNSVKFGNGSVGMGRAVLPLGDYSIAMGRDNKSTGDYSFVANKENIADGWYSASFGNGVQSNSANMFSIGSYNKVIVGTKNEFVEEEAIFDIGIGKSESERKSAMTVLKNGNVGIGTITPEFALHVNGNVAGTGAYTNLSDKRFKKDIKPIENALDKVLKINGVTFNWNQKYSKYKNLDKDNHIGFLAQDLEDILPQVVHTSSDKMGTKTVAYGDIVPVLVEAIKEQQKQIEQLQEMQKKLIILLNGEKRNVPVKNIKFK